MNQGLFPFGQPNTQRPPRLAERSEAFVVGVYPSAFHISWTPPAKHDDRPDAKKRHPYIAALAVDVEPVVFWDGRQPNPTDLFDEWARAIGSPRSSAVRSHPARTVRPVPGSSSAT